MNTITQILYVEDKKQVFKSFKKDLIALLAEKLPNNEINMVNAENAEKGRSLFENGFFDIVIFDLKMPKVDGGPEEPRAGLELLKELSETERWTSNEPSYFLFSAFHDTIENAKAMAIDSSLVSEDMIYDKRRDEDSDRLLDDILMQIKSPENQKKFRYKTQHNKLLNLFKSHGYATNGDNYIKLILNNENSNYGLLKFGRDLNAFFEVTIKMLFNYIFCLTDDEIKKNTKIENKKWSVFRFKNDKYNIKQPQPSNYINYLNRKGIISSIEADFLRATWNISNALKHYDEGNDSSEFRAITKEEYDRLDAQEIKSMMFTSIDLLMNKLRKSSADSL
tara:strand:- start:4920 stop:5927 length:1008 start_codon:yes stop_codon:yes gene_type:complete